MDKSDVERVERAIAGDLWDKLDYLVDTVWHRDRRVIVLVNESRSVDRVPAEGTYVATSTWYGWVGGDLPYDVLLNARFDGEEVVLGEVRFRPRPDRPVPITTPGVRKISLAAGFDEAISTLPPTRGPRSDGIVFDLSDEARTSFERMRSEQHGARRRWITEDDWKALAETYNDAVASGAKTGRAVAVRFGIPLSTAKGRIRRARRMGWLPPSAEQAEE